MSEFAVTRSIAGEGLIALSLTGELDIDGVPLFEAELLRAMADSPATVAVDLAGLEFLDSTGLRAIVEAHETLSAQGARLVLTEGPRNVQLTFSLTGLEAHLTFIGRIEDLQGSGGVRGTYGRGADPPLPGARQHGAR